MSPIQEQSLAQAAKAMLQALHDERAKFVVQRVTNGHTEDSPCGVVQDDQPVSYAEREIQLDEAEARLRAEFETFL